MTATPETPTPPTPPTPPAPPGNGARWMRRLLVVSLALNLLIVGLVAGAMIGGPRIGDRTGDRPPSALRELGFGPYGDALTRRDRRELGRAFEREAGSFRENRAEMRRQFDAFLAALRADPYDPAAVRALVAAQSAKIGERQALGRALMLERIEAMSPAERAAYADRLDQAIRRGPRR